MISFILFAVGMAALIKKKIGAEAIMLVTGLIGGFLYHLLFEAKSQYVLTYFIIMLLFASYGLYFILKPRKFSDGENSEKKKSKTLLSLESLIISVKIPISLSRAYVPLRYP